MRKTMRCFIVMLSLVFAFTLFPADVAFADSKCGDNITWKVSGKTLTLTGSGDMYDFELYETPWDNYSNIIQSIIFQGNITHIGDNSFSWFVDLKSVVIPSSVKTIGDGAFNKCLSLSTVVIPNGVVKIDCCAFFGCDLRSIYIPNSVTLIGDYAFSGCYELVKVSGGANVRTIGYEAFSDCPKLKSFVVTSKTLKKIGEDCFLNDRSLKTLSIKKTIKLSKSGVKKSLHGSYIKTVKVKKSKVKKYKKYFTKKNAGRKVKVKK